MDKDKIIDARNKTYDMYWRFARKISEIDNGVLKGIVKDLIK